MSSLPADQDPPDARNHPLAIWMAAIAFLNFNVPIGCIYGSFSVLLAAAQTRLHVGQDAASLGIPAVSLCTALAAPVVGALAARYSLRLIMILGSLFTIAGFVVLAFTATLPFYLIAYGLLIGPGMAVGVVLPGTLVTRWFTVNRGIALGVMSTALIVVVMPEISSWVMHSYGLPTTYLMLAAVAATATISNFFIIDHPPAATAPAADKVEPTAGAAPLETPAVAAAPTAPAGEGMTMVQLLRSSRFWGLTTAFIASAVSSIILTVHMVPLAQNWGLTVGQGAYLLSAMSFMGIAGTNLFGWLADRLGATVAVTLVVFNSGVLWLVLLVNPSFPVAVLIIGLIGLNAAGAVPAFSAALSEVFGRESFSRGYGLVQLIILPFSVACVPIVAFAHTHTGTYTGSIIGMAAILLLAAAAAASAHRRRRVPAPV